MLWERPVRLLYEYSTPKFKSDPNGLGGLPMPPKTGGEATGLSRLFEEISGKFGPKQHVHLVQMDEAGEVFRVAIFENEGGGLTFLHRDQIVEFATAVANRPKRGTWTFTPKLRPNFDVIALEVPEWANFHLSQIALILLKLVQTPQS